MLSHKSLKQYSFFLVFFFFYFDWVGSSALVLRSLTLKAPLWEILALWSKVEGWRWYCSYKKKERWFSPALARQRARGKAVPSRLHPLYQRDLAPQPRALKLANKPLTWRMGAFQVAATELDSEAGESHTALFFRNPRKFSQPPWFLAFSLCSWGSWGKKPGVLEFMGSQSDTT